MICLVLDEHMMVRSGAMSCARYHNAAVETPHDRTFAEGKHLSRPGQYGFRCMH